MSYNRGSYYNPRYSSKKHSSGGGAPGLSGSGSSSGGSANSRSVGGYDDREYGYRRDRDFYGNYRSSTQGGNSNTSGGNGGSRYDSKYSKYKLYNSAPAKRPYYEDKKRRYEYSSKYYDLRSRDYSRDEYPNENDRKDNDYDNYLKNPHRDEPREGSSKTFSSKEYSKDHGLKDNAKDYESSDYSKKYTGVKDYNDKHSRDYDDNSHGHFKSRDSRDFKRSYATRKLSDKYIDRSKKDNDEKLQRNTVDDRRSESLRKNSIDKTAELLRRNSVDKLVKSSTESPLRSQVDSSRKNSLDASVKFTSRVSTEKSSRKSSVDFLTRKISNDKPKNDEPSRSPVSNLRRNSSGKLPETHMEATKSLEKNSLENNQQPNNPSNEPKKVTDPRLLHLFDDDYKEPTDNAEINSSKVDKDSPDTSVPEKESKEDDQNNSTSPKGDAKSMGVQTDLKPVKLKSLSEYLKSSKAKKAKEIEDKKNIAPTSENQDSEGNVPVESNKADVEKTTNEGKVNTPPSESKAYSNEVHSKDQEKKDQEKKDHEKKYHEKESHVHNHTVATTADKPDNTSKIKVEEHEISQPDSDQVESDAETVIADNPPVILKSRQYIRRNDNNRHNLKRKIVDSSSEDEHEERAKKSHKPNRRTYTMKRDSGGRSLLQRACKRGQLDEISEYLDQGASANEKDFCGFTCLHEAALEGHTEVVKLLIERGGNVNAKADAAGDCETPLIDAAENKHTECVRVLLENGADPTIFNIDGFTALTKIYHEHKDEEGYEEIIKLLENAMAKNREADPNEMYFAELIKKRGIYKYAAEGYKENTANYFVLGNSLSAKPDILILAARNGHTELVDIILGLLPMPYNIDTVLDCGATALMASVGRGHPDVVELLISKGADPRKRRKQDGLSCLEIAERLSHYDEREVAIIRRSLGMKTKENAQEKTQEKTQEKIKEKIKEKTQEKTKEPLKKDDGYGKPTERQEPDSAKVQSDEMDIDMEEEEEPKGSNSGILKDSVLDDKDHVTSNTVKSESKSEVEIESNAEVNHDTSKPSPPANITKTELTPNLTGAISHSFHKSKSSSSIPMVTTGETKTHQVHTPKEASPITSGSSSPAPLTKAQEELKARNAEEARAWQEKVEAKKRMRRDMFLKSEKEKERKRREEEERRAEQEKKEQELRELERVRLAQEAEKELRELETERKQLRKQLLNEALPEGLRSFKRRTVFDFDMSLRYCPLYLFEVNGTECVTDFQISLIVGQQVPGLNKKDVPVGEKSKMWNLFYNMIAGKSQLRAEGYGQFMNLLVSYISLADVMEALKELHGQVLELVKNRIVRVDLNEMKEFSLESHSVVEDKDVKLVVSDKGVFIPPKLRGRRDIVRVISGKTKGLW